MPGVLAAIAKKSKVVSEGPPLPVRARDWVLGCVLVYASLFGVGKWILGEPALGIGLLVIAVLSAVLLARDLRSRPAFPARRPGWGGS